MNEEKLRLSAPWILLYNQIEALFRKDPAVSVVYVENWDGSEKTIKLYVDGHDKVGALEKLLPKVYMFGGVAVNVEILPSNLDGCTRLELFQKAFEGNPAFVGTIAAQEEFAPFDLNYVVFKAEVVQYESDNIGDPNKLTSTLYQELAREIFKDEKNVLFCTEKMETVN